MFMIIVLLTLILTNRGDSSGIFSASVFDEDSDAHASQSQLTAASAALVVAPPQAPASSTAVLETITLRGLNNEVLREYQVDNGDELNRWKWTRDYIYAGNKLLASEAPGGLRHYHLDHLGTIRVITDAAGNALSSPYEYFPFGDEATAEPPPDERFRFTSHERDINDPLKPDYMHARFYYRGGSAGKFLSIDPARDWDSTKPQSWNLYSYVRNNPITQMDPDGRVIGAPVTYLKGLQTIAAVRDGSYERHVRSEMERWLADPRIQQAMKTAWQQSKLGLSGLEAGFTIMSYNYKDPVSGEVKEHTVIDRRFGNTTKHVQLGINSLTQAVFHTHPSASSGEPSTPENNYNNDPNGGDTQVAADNTVPVIVMHKTGLRMYDPVLNKTLLIREGLSWLPNN
jgi:RHS repeat-associated protein